MRARQTLARNVAARREIGLICVWMMKTCYRSSVLSPPPACLKTAARDPVLSQARRVTDHLHEQRDDDSIDLSCRTRVP